MNKTYTVSVRTTETFTEGWGVLVDPIWDFDEATGEDRGVSDIEVTVVPITKRLTKLKGNVPCVPVPGNNGNYWSQVENFAHVDDVPWDDHHDLRTRWFATEEEANEHAAFVLGQWANPAPWVSFIQL